MSETMEATMEAEQMLRNVEAQDNHHIQGVWDPVASSRKLTKELLKVLNLEVRNVPVRSSARKRFRECPRKFLFEERLGLTSHKYAAALEIGSFFHELVAPLYGGMPLENIPTLVAGKVEDIYKGLEKVVDPTGVLPSGTTLSDQMCEIEKDMKLSAALAAVFAKYLPPERLLENYEVVSIEKAYGVRLPRLSVPLVFQPDVLLRHKKTGLYWIVDHKTTSLKTATRAATLRFEFQPRFYQLCLHLWLAGNNPVDEVKSEVGGYIHNIVRKPTIRQKTKSGETLEAYVDRVHAWFQEENTLYPDDPPIVQSVVHRKGSILDEELLVAVYQTARASSAKLNLARFPKDDSACFGMFGNSPCVFLKLCQNEHNLLAEWPEYIARNFKQSWRHWEDNK